MTITDIRHEGFYITEDNGETSVGHTEETLDLLNKAIAMVDDQKYHVCDGVSFINGEPHAELIDFDGELHYVRMV